MSHWYNNQGDLIDPWTPGAMPSPSTILDIVYNREREGLFSRLGQEDGEELMRKAADRGTRVHATIEALLNRKIILIDGKFVGDEEIRPYVNAFVEWWNKYKPIWREVEYFVLSNKHKYGGTADLIVELDGQTWVIDLKTGQDSVRHGLQLKFYQQAYYEMTGIRARMGVLALDPTRACGYRHSKSPYGLKEYKEPLTAIKAHLDVFKWWNKKHPIKAPKEVPVWAGMA